MALRGGGAWNKPPLHLDRDRGSHSDVGSIGRAFSRRMRYDVIAFVLVVTPRYAPGSHPSSPPDGFLRAVCEAVNAGAALVGGVATTALERPDGSSTFTFSQAVLYP